MDIFEPLIISIATGCVGLIFFLIKRNLNKNEKKMIDRDELLILNSNILNQIEGVHNYFVNNEAKKMDIKNIQIYITKMNLLFSKNDKIINNINNFHKKIVILKNSLSKLVDHSKEEFNIIDILFTQVKKQLIDDQSNLNNI